MNTIKINSSNKYRSNRASNKDTDETEIADKLTTIPPLKPRRILLKKSATAGIAGLLVPLEWSKPIINSVIMPSHAQTSDEVVVVSDDETTQTPTTQTSDEVVVVSDDEVTQAPTTQTPTTQPTTTVEPINIALSLDCNSTSSTLTGGDNGSVEITGTVVSSTPITDMTGIEITITLDPEDTFVGARDASNNIITSLGGTQITATTDNQGNFTVTHILGDYVQVMPELSNTFYPYPYCTAIGYEIELSHANSTFLDNNPNIGTIQISDVLCSDINDCIQIAPPSDIRLKTDIQPLAVVNNHKIYQFKYRADANNTDYVGVMAQDLVGVHDDALLLSDDGFYRVYYDKLGLEMTTLEQWLEHGQNAVIKH